MAQSLELLLIQFLMPDNDARRQAEEQIKQLAKDPADGVDYISDSKVLIPEAIGVDYINNSKVLIPADDSRHNNKCNFRVLFVCRYCYLGEALRRIRATQQGGGGDGNIVEAVRHVRPITGDLRSLRCMDDDEVLAHAKKIAAMGVATPANATMMMMQLGCLLAFVFLRAEILRGMRGRSC